MSTYILVSKEEANNVLIHSSGAWKNHKYIRKEGKRYIYAKKGGGHEVIGEPHEITGNKQSSKRVKNPRGVERQEIEDARKTSPDYYKKDGRYSEDFIKGRLHVSTNKVDQIDKQYLGENVSYGRKKMHASRYRNPNLPEMHKITNQKKKKSNKK